MIGATVGGCKLLEEIGGGGFGSVYKATQLSLDRTVAVKRLRESDSSGEKSVGSFSSQARLAAKLEHPNIIRVYSYGREDGIPFIVMEYVEGKTLSALILERGRIPVDEALDIAGHIAEALDYAHGQGVTHSDLNPCNIMLSRGQVVIGDFLGCRPGDCGGRSVVGVPEYISPEQARGQSATPRSDMYSLGIILYEMLTGKPPFSGATPADTLFQQISMDPEPPARVNPVIPARLDRLITRMLAKNPDVRFETCGDVAKEIEAVRKELSATNRKPKRERRPVSWALVAALAAVLAGLGSVGYLSARSIAQERELDALAANPSRIAGAEPALQRSVIKRYNDEMRLGQRLLNLGQYRSAATAFHRSNKLRPDQIDPRLFLAAIFIERQSFRNVKAQLQAALRINPRNRQARDAMNYVDAQIRALNRKTR